MSNSRAIFLPTCSICQDDEAGMDIVATACGHIFHRDCIRTWDQTQLSRRQPTKCPSCNITMRRATTVTTPARFITLHSLNERDINEQGSSQPLDPSRDPSSDPRLTRFREENNTLKLTLREREATIQQLTLEPLALRGERDKLNANLRVLSQARHELEDRIIKCSRDLRIERKQRTDERMALTLEEKRIKTELDKLNEKYRILKSEGDQLHEQYLKKVSENEELQSFVSEFGQEKARFQATEAALRAQLQDSFEKFKSLKAANAVYKSKLDEVKKKRNLFEDRAAQSITSSVRRCDKFYPDVSKKTIQLPVAIGSQSQHHAVNMSTQSSKRTARESTHRQSNESSKRICWTNKTKEPLRIEIQSSPEPEVTFHPSSSNPQSSPHNNLAPDKDLVLPSLFGKDFPTRDPTRNKLPLPFTHLQLNQPSSSSPFKFNKPPNKLFSVGPKVRHK